MPPSKKQRVHKEGSDDDSDNEDAKDQTYTPSDDEACPEEEYKESRTSVKNTVVFVVDNREPDEVCMKGMKLESAPKNQRAIINRARKDKRGCQFRLEWEDDECGGMIKLYEKAEKAEEELEDFREWIDTILSDGKEYEEFPSSMLRNPVMIFISGWP
jgi:hypothetical protein